MATDIDPVEFKADLAKMDEVIGTVKTESGNVKDTMIRIGQKFSEVENAWKSPSSKSFHDVQDWFMRVSRDLTDLLDEMGRRLQQAHDNYHSAEYANYNNET